MVRMGVVEADDVEVALPRLALNADEFLRGDVVPVVSRVGSGVAAAPRFVHSIHAIRGAAEQHAATLMGIGFFPMASDRVVYLLSQRQHGRPHSSQNRSLRYLSAESGRIVTMTASLPSALTSSAMRKLAPTAAPDDTPTSRPSVRP